MKIGDMVKLYDVYEKGDVITRIGSIEDHTLTTVCGILWWIEKPVNKGNDYEILSFSDYLRLIKI